MLTTDECLDWMKSEVPEALLADKQLADINKAGIVPLVEDPASGITQILLIKPRPKKKHLGEVKWQLIKGTRMLKPANKDWRDYKLGEPLDGSMQLEPLLCAALREGNEEAGLIFDNISAMGLLGQFSFKSKTTGNQKLMQLYALLMKDPQRFDWPGKQHQFTQAMQWFPIHALPKDMRGDAKEIIDQIKKSFDAMKVNETAPAFSNPLMGSSSLYLRQHAHNPVMWYPWGRDAVALAKKQNKPILLSIGYSSCYWCHVMEREIFENVSIASYMNQHFICIKVDREEHPTLDETYMVARQLLTREGGWPNNIFLTPELKPFYACGTMGLDESPNRPSFPRLLEWLHLRWINEQESLQKDAAEIHRLTTRFLKMRNTDGAQPMSLAGLAHNLLDQLITQHDDIRGGFFSAPKFPHETYLSYLLHIGESFDHPAALNIAVNSLLKMAAGGIYDQVGCGFHRYAVDKNWYVPHFEKMLYNQAMCASAYIKATRLTNNFYLGDVAQGTLEFVSGPMTSPFGAFYSSIDAETDAVEGAYYVWKPEEILDILSAEEAAFFQHYFALADIPHYPGHKAPDGQAIILRKPLWQSAQEEGLPYVQLAAMSGEVLNKLLHVRNQRPAPGLDQKIITSWNGLMIKAYAEGYAQFQNPKYKDLAIAAARYFYMRYQESGKLHHTYDGYKASAEAALEDYAFLAMAVLSIHRSCGSTDIDWLDFARDLLRDSKARFFELKSKVYRLNPKQSLPDIAITHATDSTLPSAAASMLHANLMMYEITGDKTFKQHLKAIQPSYIAEISPQGALEYCELLTVYSQLALIEQDNDFKEEMSILLGSAHDAKNVLEFSANIAKGEEIKANDIFHIEVEISLQDGWMIDAISPPDRPDSTTLIAVIGKNILNIQSMQLPKAQTLTDKTGTEKQVYMGKVTLVLEVKCSTIISRQPIEVQLDYQPCTQGQCYMAQRKTHRL